MKVFIALKGTHSLFLFTYFFVFMCSILVWLCGFYYGAFHVESCFDLCCRGFAVLFGIVIISLGEERADICASRGIGCLFCTR